MQFVLTSKSVRFVDQNGKLRRVSRNKLPTGHPYAKAAGEIGHPIPTGGLDAAAEAEVLRIEGAQK